MTRKNTQYLIPKFNNLAEEDKFWQSHSPLIEDYEGKVQKKKQNRASFLSIRLTGEELAQLRQRSLHYGLGPSTYARQILIQALESETGYTPPDLLFRMYSLCNVPDERKEEYYKQLQQLLNGYRKIQDEFAKTLMELYDPNLINQTDKPEILHIKESKHT